MRESSIAALTGAAEMQKVEPPIDNKAKNNVPIDTGGSRDN